MNQKLHFKTHIPSKTSLKIGCHWTTKKIFSHHLMNPKWWSKMDLIHHGRLKFIVIIWWWPNLIDVIRWQPNSITMQLWWSKTFQLPPPRGNGKPFDHHHMWQWETCRSPRCISLPPHPLFFFLLCFPPLIVTKTLLIAMLCDPLIKRWGY